MQLADCRLSVMALGLLDCAALIGMLIGSARAYWRQWHRQTTVVRLLPDSGRTTVHHSHRRTP